jgi:hypothetical protein
MAFQADNGRHSAGLETRAFCSEDVAALSFERLLLGRGRPKHGRWRSRGRGPRGSPRRRAGKLVRSPQPVARAVLRRRVGGAAGMTVFTAVWQAGDSLATLRSRHSRASLPPGEMPEQLAM